MAGSSRVHVGWRSRLKRLGGNDLGLTIRPHGMQMSDAICPCTRLSRFQRVTVCTGRLGAQFREKEGTVIWQCAPEFDRRNNRWTEWIHCVSLPALQASQWFLESDLNPLAAYDSEQDHLGKGYELSFDTEVGVDMEMVEGCYRTLGRFWHVFSFAKANRFRPLCRFRRWPSGIAGVEFDVPRNVELNTLYIIMSLTDLYNVNVSDWTFVRGPDSFYLK
jgi:hypothetical protein